MSNEKNTTWIPAYRAGDPFSADGIKGHLPFVQVGSKMFIDRRDIEAFIQKY